MIDEMKDNVIRLKVFTDVVKFDTKAPIYKYKKLNLQFPMFDHMRMLKIGKEQIGYLVSPYNLNDHMIEHLQMEDHIVVEMKQLYHPNAQTFAVIHKDYVKEAVEWKLYSVKAV